MKLKIKTWRITWRFLLAALFVLIAIFGMGQRLFFGMKDGRIVMIPWDIRQFLLISVYLGSSIAFYIISLTSCYYVIEKDHFISRKFGRTLEFQYKNIEFIDIAESERKELVIFYSSKAKMRYLLGDKDGVLLKTLIKKCPDTLTVEEFRKKHPEEKY